MRLDNIRKRLLGECITLLEKLSILLSIIIHILNDLAITTPKWPYPFAKDVEMMQKSLCCLNITWMHRSIRYA